MRECIIFFPCLYSFTDFPLYNRAPLIQTPIEVSVISGVEKLHPKTISCLLERCPHFRGVLRERFHCIYFVLCTFLFDFRIRFLRIFSLILEFYFFCFLSAVQSYVFVLFHVRMFTTVTRTSVYRLCVTAFKTLPSTSLLLPSILPNRSLSSRNRNHAHPTMHRLISSTADTFTL